MRYLTQAELTAINQYILATAGEGLHGIADPHGLDALVEQPKSAFFGREASPTLWLKAAFLLQKVTKKHVFMDGNKWTVFLTAVIFLKLNGYQLLLPQEMARDLVIEATLS